MHLLYWMWTFFMGQEHWKLLISQQENTHTVFFLKICIYQNRWTLRINVRKCKDFKIKSRKTPHKIFVNEVHWYLAFDFWHVMWHLDNIQVFRSLVSYSTGMCYPVSACVEVSVWIESFLYSKKENNSLYRFPPCVYIALCHSNSKIRWCTDPYRKEWVHDNVNFAHWSILLAYTAPSLRKIPTAAEPVPDAQPWRLHLPLLRTPGDGAPHHPLLLWPQPQSGAPLKHDCEVLPL